MTPKERKLTLDLMAAAAARSATKLPFGDTATRLLARPMTFDKTEHTVEAVLSVGSPVKRFYGTEILKISADAIDLSRIKTGGVPVLNSHDQFNALGILGKVDSSWITANSSGKNELRGLLRFSQTDEGIKAAGMVERGEIAGISAGYRVETWLITDAEGRVIDPEVDRIRFDDDLTFTATRWTLLEASLCAIPADQLSTIRMRGGDCAVPDAIFALAGIGAAEVAPLPAAGFSVSDAIARTRARQAMHDRAQAHKIRSRVLDARASAILRMRIRQRMHDRQQALLDRTNPIAARI